MHSINWAGLELIKSFEGFRATPYRDGSGKWTIGYGHTQAVSAGTPPVSESVAEALLQEDLINAENVVSHLITALLNDNQFAALVSLTFNCGTAPLTHRLGQLVNAGDMLSAAEAFMTWTFIDGVKSPGLIRRRTAEKTLFLTPL